jgi:hypothetical protein
MGSGASVLLGGQVHTTTNSTVGPTYIDCEIVFYFPANSESDLATDPDYHGSASVSSSG